MKRIKVLDDALVVATDTGIARWIRYELALLREKLRLLDEHAS